MNVRKIEYVYIAALAVVLLVFCFAMTVNIVYRTLDLIFNGEPSHCDSVNYINYGQDAEQDNGELTK